VPHHRHRDARAVRGRPRPGGHGRGIRQPGPFDDHRKVDGLCALGSEEAMSKRISRRAWLTSAGLLLTGCSRETFVPPRVRGGLIGAADVLTMSVNRLLLFRQQLAREYPRSEVADPFPTWNQTNPRNEEYRRHLSEGFRNWRLPITGLVNR